MEKLNVMRLKPTAVLPERKTTGSVGYDISACLNEEITIAPGETNMVGSGLVIALEQGYAAFIYARSGLGIKQGIIPANCVGVIDSDYRGEVIVGLKNTSKIPFKVKDGDRIAQMVISKCELPEIVPSFMVKLPSKTETPPPEIREEEAVLEPDKVRETLLSEIAPPFIVKFPPVT